MGLEYLPLLQSFVHGGVVKGAGDGSGGWERAGRRRWLAAQRHRLHRPRSGDARIAHAAAKLIARAGGAVGVETGGGALQLVGQRCQVGNVLAGMAQLLCEQVPESVLDRLAFAAIPGEGEVRDFLQAATQLLGPGDERQPIDGPIVVEPIPRRRPVHGRQQADFLVVAQTLPR